MEVIKNKNVLNKKFDAKLKNKYSFNSELLKNFIKEENYKILYEKFQNNIIFGLEIEDKDIRIEKNQNFDFDFNLIFKEYDDDDNIIIRNSYLNELNNNIFTIIIDIKKKIKIKFSCDIEINKNSLRYKIKNNLISIKEKKNDDEEEENLNNLHHLLNGLDYEEIDIIKKFKKYIKKFKKGSLNNKCTICLGEINQFCLIECNHYYCLNCIKEWNDLNNKCPNCKKSITQLIYESGENENNYKIEKVEEKVYEVEEDEIDPVMNANDYCEVCKESNNYPVLLVCENCFKTCCHIYCLNPPLENLSDEKWYCDYCVVNYNIPSTLPIAGILKKENIPENELENDKIEEEEEEEITLKKRNKLIKEEDIFIENSLENKDDINNNNINNQEEVYENNLMKEEEIEKNNWIKEELLNNNLEDKINDNIIKEEENINENENNNFIKEEEIINEKNNIIKENEIEKNNSLKEEEIINEIEKNNSLKEEEIINEIEKNNSLKEEEIINEIEKEEDSKNFELLKQENLKINNLKNEKIFGDEVNNKKEDSLIYQNINNKNTFLSNETDIFEEPKEKLLLYKISKY